MLCKICNTQTQKKFETIVLGKYHIACFHCPSCLFLQSEEPFWLAEAYQNPITITDTGIVTRNVAVSKIVAVLLFFLFKKNGKFVDYAGGYGILTRMLRDIGFDYYWCDKYTNNLFAQGFEYKAEQGPIEVVTAFECFEHFVAPMSELESIMTIAPTVIFTTQLLPDVVPLPHEWWYYDWNNGQHISFYHHKTFEYLAERFGLTFHSHWGMHMLTRRKVSNFAFKQLIEWCNRGLFAIVKKNMHGRAVDDSNFLKQLHL
jgi:hypothetical protein